MISTRMKNKSMMATPGKRIRLKDFDPAFKGDYKSHAHAQSKLKANVQRLAKYQDLLYSSHTYALLLISAGHGCGRQRRHHQARDVGRQP